MFNDKNTESFRSITAPEELKAKIEKELYLKEKRKSSQLKSVLALAACFTVIFAFLLSASLSDSKIALMYEGTKISSEALPISSTAEPSIARAAIFSGIPFEIKVKEKTTLTVSDGGLLKEGKSERTEKIVLTEEGITGLYLVFEDEHLPLTLTVETEAEKAVYVFSYDEAKGYVIYKDAEK